MRRTFRKYIFEFNSRAIDINTAYRVISPHKKKLSKTMI
jgi:hypothetical protein